jgi:predicted nucleic acid-binding protein
MAVAIVDTGPLVAFLDRNERHHAWAVARIDELEAPLLVCEPVLAEAMYLLGSSGKGQDALFALLENGALRLALQIEQHVAALRALCRKYRDTPMSLADACVVRMAELYERHMVFTLDSDFTIYRKLGRAPLSLIYPAKN